MAFTDVGTEASSSELAVKTVHYKNQTKDGLSRRVSLPTFREMIARWEIGPDDPIRLDGDAAERRVRDVPSLSPLDEMLRSASRKLIEVRKGKGKRTEVVLELEMLLKYAELNDSVSSTASFLLGWLRYAENPALARGLFLRTLERGYPFPSLARNNLAVCQVRLGDPAGRDNLILAANDPRRSPTALFNLARLLGHLKAIGEDTDEIASIKDLERVARREWAKAPPKEGDPGRYALFLCEGDIPVSFASRSRHLSRAQGQIEDLLADGEEHLKHGKLEQAMAHAARAASEIERAREDLGREDPDDRTSVLRFLRVRLSRLQTEASSAKELRGKKEQLEVFRARLERLEKCLKLPVPPADLIQQAEILVGSARTDAEREEAGSALRECQDSVARHLLRTADELLRAGEKEVAVGLFQRALAYGSRESDEIKLRLANVRREALVEEVSRAISQRSFEEARAKVSLLRAAHPIFEPVANRLEAEVKASEANALLERVAELSGARFPTKDCLEEARRLLEAALALHPDPGALKPMEIELRRKGGWS